MLSHLPLLLLGAFIACWVPLAHGVLATDGFGAHDAAQGGRGLVRIRQTGGRFGTHKAHWQWWSGSGGVWSRKGTTTRRNVTQREVWRPQGAHWVLVDIKPDEEHLFSETRTCTCTVHFVQHLTIS